MRKVIVWGFVLVAVGLLFTGAQAQRIAPINTAPAAKPSQVEVTNFPPVQQVGGTVSVGNFPAVQAVSGTVAISNLPAQHGPLTVRSTSATYTGNLGGRTGATQKCRAEFPNSHWVSAAEITDAVAHGGVVWLSSETTGSWIDTISTDGGDTCNNWLSDQPGLFPTTVGQDGHFPAHDSCASLLALLCGE